MLTPQTRLKIRYYGDPSLRRRSKPVSKVADAERSILEQMAELMRLSGGVGLAAPQVGINKQMVMVDVGNGLATLINPRILKKTGFEVMEEGCLSLPGVYVKVRRPRKIVVSGYNEQNEKITLNACDLFARALQHEIDHLRGRLIIDYANLFAKMRLRKKLKSLESERIL